VFSEWQPKYAEHGIATFPVHLGEVKKPAVKNYLKIGKAASAALTERFGEANAFGFACERSKITVLDVDTDNERVLADALDKHGQTPIVIRSVNGHFHAWYKRNGERRHVRPWKDLPIDVLGGGYVVAPPSVATKGAYEFLQGSLDDLTSLPTLRNVSDLIIKTPKPAAAIPDPDRDRSWNEMTEGSGRNDALFHDLGHKAHHVASFDDLLIYARSRNAEFGEPMPDAEVVRIAGNIWRYECKARNWIGRGRQRQAEIDGLIAEPYTVALLEWCRVHHGQDNIFMLADGLSEALGWPRRAVPNVASSSRAPDPG
jgi:Bifunctional DNA primase/polymerase, N-terminal